MTADALLAAARGCGLSVWRDGEKVKAEGPTALMARWLPELRAVKPELLALLADEPAAPAGGAPEAAGQARVYRVLVAMGPSEPDRAAIMVASGCDLGEATAAARNVFGAHRVRALVQIDSGSMP